MRISDWSSDVCSSDLPYVFLTLGDPYRALDGRFARTALCLGARPNRVFWQVKMQMLLRPLLFALAVAFAVSVNQYLPTMFAGGERGRASCRERGCQYV